MSGPNWKRIQKLRDHVAALPARRVRMDKLLVINRAKETAGEARRPECGTVGCLAGHAMVLFAPVKKALFRDDNDVRGVLCNVAGSLDDIYEAARGYLGLDDTGEAEHMFYAEWHPTLTWNSGDIKRRDVIKYLDKAIAAKDVMVTI